MKLQDIWNAIDQGKTVHYGNNAYKVHPVESNGSKYAKETERGDQALRCTYIYNYFGSYLSEAEFEKCFIKED